MTAQPEMFPAAPALFDFTPAELPHLGEPVGPRRAPVVPPPAGAVRIGPREWAITAEPEPEPAELADRETMTMHERLEHWHDSLCGRCWSIPAVPGSDRCERCAAWEANPIVHARRRPAKRSPHRAGRITPANVLDADPRGLTLCGADPTSYDLGNRSARSKVSGGLVTCEACRALVAAELEREQR